MEKQTAFIFDLNGTMVDDMHYHNKAWYDIIVTDLGASLTKEEVEAHMYGKSQEILVRIFGKDKFTPAVLDRICFEKEHQYRMLYRSHLDLMPGLFTFLEKAYDENIPMAIGSAAVIQNIRFVIEPLKISHYFKAIVSADDVANSKPHPETFLKAASLLRVDPEHCIVFEDAPKGVEAAARAGMNAVVLTTMHTPREFTMFDNVLGFIDDFSCLDPEYLYSNNLQNFLKNVG